LVLDSEFVGNLADLCPVGALTLKPYKFIGRPWESREDSIENTNIITQHFNNKNVKMFSNNYSKNTASFIDDKERFVSEGILNQQIDKPLLFGEVISYKNILFTISGLVKYGFFMGLQPGIHFITEKETTFFENS